MHSEDLKGALAESQQRLVKLRKYLDVAGRTEELVALEAVMAEGAFWDDQEKAQETIGKVKAVKSVIEPFKKVEAKCDELEVMMELLEAEADEAMEAEACDLASELLVELDKLELLSFLSGKQDENSAILTIHAGAGGTESCDWAGILFRLYTRWAERRGFEYEVLDYLDGDEAGLKSATILIRGAYAYGYLRSELGVHRLVRISPFDSNSRRHTSFASVDVTPEIDDTIEVDIDEKDLRVDTFRSSGAGGQHVNTTDSAVRITHLPTGVVVASQAERSQHKNKAFAMKVLRSKLYELEEQRRREEADGGPKADVGWGSQIRSYVLHPYQMVKDLRTNVETSNTGAVLDGEIDQFIDAFLRSEEHNVAK